MDKQKDRLLKIFQEIPNLEQKLKAGKKVVRLLEKYLATLEKTEKKLSNSDAGLNILFQNVTNLRDNVSQLQESAQSSLAEIKKMEDESKQLLDSISSLPPELTALKEKARNINDSVQGELDKATEKNKTIDALKSSIDPIIVQITSKLDEATNKTSELSKLYEEFLSIREKINNPNSGLTKTLEECGVKRDEIQTIRKQTDTLFTEISRMKDSSNAFLNDIEKIKTRAEIEGKKIQDYEKTSEEFKAKIAQIYEVITGTGLANSFDARKKELMKGTTLWFRMLIISIIVGVLFGAWVYHEIFLKGLPTIDAVAWYRLTLSLPVVFLIGFSSIQYSRERSLLEKYAFKSATALALEAYTQLLTGKFPKHQEQIISFVLDAMTMIYKEPHEKEKRYRFNIGLKIFNIGLEEEQMEDLAEDILETKMKPIIDRHLEKTQPKKTASDVN